LTGAESSGKGRKGMRERADVWGPRGSEREGRGMLRGLVGRKAPWVGPAAEQIKRNRPRSLVGWFAI
jgi:hypothetical protein